MSKKTDLYFNLPKNWEDIVREVFMNGGSDIEAFISIGVDAIGHKELLTIDQYSNEFTNGMAICEAYWMKWARENLSPSESITENDDGSITKVERFGKPDIKLFDIMMKRMFAWDKKLDKNKEDKIEPKGKDAEIDKFKKKYGLKIAK